jgi:hypothetical protein
MRGRASGGAPAAVERYSAPVFGFAAASGVVVHSLAGTGATAAAEGSPPPPQSTGQLRAVSPHDFTHCPSPHFPQRAAAAAGAGVEGAGSGAASLVALQSAGHVRSFSQDGAQ